MGKLKLFTVVYRTGGTARFAWHRTEPVQTREEADKLRADIIRSGYEALYPQDYDLSMSVGLPETFDVTVGR